MSGDGGSLNLGESCSVLEHGEGFSGILPAHCMANCLLGMHVTDVHIGEKRFDFSVQLSPEGRTCFVAHARSTLDSTFLRTQYVSTLSPMDLLAALVDAENICESEHIPNLSEIFTQTSLPSSPAVGDAIQESAKPPAPCEEFTFSHSFILTANDVPAVQIWLPRKRFQRIFTSSSTYHNFCTKLSTMKRCTARQKLLRKFQYTLIDTCSFFLHSQMELNKTNKCCQGCYRAFERLRKREQRKKFSSETATKKYKQSRYTNNENVAHQDKSESQEGSELIQCARILHHLQTSLLSHPVSRKPS